MLLVWHVVFKNRLDKSQRFSIWRPSQPSLELLEKTRSVKQKAKVSAVVVLYDVLVCVCLKAQGGDGRVPGALSRCSSLSSINTSSGVDVESPSDTASLFAQHLIRR